MTVETPQSQKKTERGQRVKAADILVRSFGADGEQENRELSPKGDSEREGGCLPDFLHGGGLVVSRVLVGRTEVPQKYWKGRALI